MAQPVNISSVLFNCGAGIVYEALSGISGFDAYCERGRVAAGSVNAKGCGARRLAGFVNFKGEQAAAR